MIRIGILSDTHGYWHPKITHFFCGVSLILHAGDICSHEVIDNLERIAPLKAVRGNSDFYPLSVMYPFQEFISVGNFQILLTHQFNEFKASDRYRISKIPDLKMVICGHTHAYSLRQAGKITILNPGSAAKKGRLDPPGIVILTLEGERFQTERLLF